VTEHAGTGAAPTVGGAAGSSPRSLSPRAWWLAIRPKTLTAAIAPVRVGAALAAFDGVFSALPAIAALVGAVLIQIGTNLSNDVLDFHRGADHAERLGPTRVTQAGLISPNAVAAAAAACFVLAAAVGAYLTYVAGIPILIVGSAAIVSGVLYTAGPKPLAYVGLGDLFVMLFFGLAAVAGTYYVQAVAVTAQGLLLGVAVGALSVAILNINNLRDLESDRRAGKRTLATRLGPRTTRKYFAGLVMSAFAIPLGMMAAGLLPWTLLTIAFALPQATRLVGAVIGGAEGRTLNPLLGATARLQITHAALLALGLLVAPAAPTGL